MPRKILIRRAVTGGLLAAALLVMTGCSGGGASDTMSAGADSELNSTADKAAPAPAPAAAAANRAPVQTRAVVETGRVELTSPHLDKVRAEIGRLLTTVGGYVDKEETSQDRSGRTEHATVVLRVPAADFATTMDTAERLGRLRSSERSSKDVTTQVIDVDARVRTVRESIERLQKFLSRSPDIDDLIRFEREITDREAELRSLTAQQTYLHDQTSMATLTLELSTPRTYVEPPGPLDDAGFLTGLRNGWHALVGFVVIGATVLGAALPFGVVLALVGVPLWLVLRVRGRNRDALTRQFPPDTPTNLGGN